MDANDFVPDNLDMNALLRTLAQAKGVLTRRTRAFVGLIEGHRAYTRQELVTVRAHMVTACDNMVAELDQFVQMNFPQDNVHYLDGRQRQAQCMEQYGAIYEDRLQDFVDHDSTGGAAHYAFGAGMDNHPQLQSEHTLASKQQSAAPSHISAATAASLRDELHQMQQQENAQLARQQRARARELRAQEIEAQAQREREAAELQARRDRELAELRRQELADQAEEEADALRIEQERNRQRLNAALSGTGRSGTTTDGHRSRASSVRTRRSYRSSLLQSVLARSASVAPSLAASHRTQRSADLLLQDPLILPPPQGGSSQKYLTRMLVKRFSDTAKTYPPYLWVITQK